jgi:hypothetical protein
LIEPKPDLSIDPIFAVAACSLRRQGVVASPPQLGAQAART